MDIREAYRIYQRITCEYEDLDRIAEIFTADVVGGNSGFGRIRGIEAQTIFLTTPRKMGLEPEDHLWCMIEGDKLAFRARVWAGARSCSAFFDAIGHLIFDPHRGQFCFYHGFYESEIAARVLGTSSTCSLEAAAEGIRTAREATARFESRAGGEPGVPDELEVWALG